LCPKAADAVPFEVPIRSSGAAEAADQDVFLAKVLVTKSFQVSV
jgi:hypothetical protein